MCHLIIKVFGLLTAVKVPGHLVAHVAGHERRLQSSEGFLHLREALQEEEATTIEQNSDSRLGSQGPAGASYLKGAVDSFVPKGQANHLKPKEVHI